MLLNMGSKHFVLFTARLATSRDKKIVQGSIVQNAIALVQEQQLIHNRLFSELGQLYCSRTAAVNCGYQFNVGVVQQYFNTLDMASFRSKMQRCLPSLLNLKWLRRLACLRTCLVTIIPFAPAFMSKSAMT
jgi:hypothetical protein